MLFIFVPRSIRTNRRRKKQQFEAKAYPQDAQERADLTNQRQIPVIPSVQKTVEVPKVHYTEKLADIRVDMQRGSKHAGR